MKYTQEELTEKAKKYFDFHPDAEEFFITDDGNVFHDEEKALNHARGHQGMESFKITRTEAEGKKTKKRKNGAAADNTAAAPATNGDATSAATTSENEGGPADNSSATAPKKTAAPKANAASKTTTKATPKSTK